MRVDVDPAVAGLDRQEVGFLGGIGESESNARRREESRQKLDQDQFISGRIETPLAARDHRIVNPWDCLPRVKRQF